MPYDPSGNFSRLYNWQADRDNNIKILAARMDGEFDNYAEGMNQVMLRSGIVPMGGNLKLGGYAITGLGNGTAANPSLSFNGEGSTGLYWPSAGNLAVSVAGVQVYNFGSALNTSFRNLAIRGGGDILRLYDAAADTLDMYIKWYNNAGDTEKARFGLNADGDMLSSVPLNVTGDITGSADITATGDVTSGGVVKATKNGDFAATDTNSQALLLRQSPNGTSAINLAFVSNDGATVKGLISSSAAGSLTLTPTAGQNISLAANTSVTGTLGVTGLATLGSLSVSNLISDSGITTVSSSNTNNTTGALRILDAVGDPHNAWLQWTNRAGNVEYGYVGFSTDSKLTIHNNIGNVAIANTLEVDALRPTEPLPVAYGGTGATTAAGINAVIMPTADINDDIGQLQFVNGVKMQWTKGTVGANVVNYYQAFPVPFTTWCIPQVSGGPANAGVGDSVNLTSYTNAGVYVTNSYDGGPLNFTVFAIGV